jgi:L-ribulose-5-phosphate 4-epimerase
MSEEGVVKYTCERISSAPAIFPGFEALNQCRNRLHELGLIGISREGIGYGNLSLRRPGTAGFHISGSATGGIAELGPAHYAEVVDFDFARNWVKCTGPIQASSESMTHAAIYGADREACAVIHIHDPMHWRKLLGQVPTTSPSVAYGTPEMAGEIARLFRETEVRQRRFIAMAGHEDGLIAFGPGITAALETLLHHLG